LTTLLCSSRAGIEGDKGNIAERHRLLFRGVAYTLERRRDVGRRTWYLRVYLKEEKKYYRQALDSTNFEEAKDEARDLMAGITQKLKNGELIMSFSLAELRRHFTLHQEKLVESGQLAQSTYQQQSYHLRNGCKFLREKLPRGMDAKLSGFSGKIFEEYLQWRMRIAERRGGNILLCSIRSELLSIRKMFKFAKKHDWCIEKAIPQWDITIKRERPRRRRLAPGDVKEVSRLAQASVNDARTPKDRYMRQLRLSILRLMGACGLRSGEALALRNSDIEVRDSERVCLITIRAETTKVRKQRRFLLDPTPDMTQTGAAQNWLLEWVNKHQRHKSANDYVFAPYDDGARSVRGIYYKSYSEFRRVLEQHGFGWFDTYHCRHFWMTSRVERKQNLIKIAQLGGTSVSELVRTYTHIFDEIASREVNDERDGHC
jgi:integrase